MAVVLFHSLVSTYALSHSYNCSGNEDPLDDLNDDDVSVASSQFSDRFRSLRGKEYTSSSSKRSSKLKINSMIEVNYKGYGKVLLCITT